MKNVFITYLVTETNGLAQKKSFFYCLVRIRNPKIFTKIKLQNQCSLTERIALVEKKETQNNNENKKQRKNK